MGTWRKKLGDVVFYRRKGEQVARALNRKPANPQTRPQVLQRSRLKPVVAMHRVLDGVAHGVLRIGETQYNGFIKSNLKEPRPEYLDSQTPATYPGTYPKLVPPMPRIGLGNGLPILMPYVVTVGRFAEPLYALINTTSPNPPFGVNAMTQQVLQPKFVFPRTFVAQAIVFLANYGIDVSANSGSVSLDPFVGERLVNFLITGQDNIHSGFLIAYYGEMEYVVNYAVYSELGDILESTLAIAWDTVDGIKEITTTTGSLVNSSGKEFRITSNPVANIQVILENDGILPNAGNASSVILSRRSGASLEVSTSRLLLSQGAAQAAYLSAFNPEVEEEAIVDYTKTVFGNDGLNFELTQ